VNAQRLADNPTLSLTPDLLSADECAALIEETDAMGYAIAPITTGMGPRIVPGVRNNTRVMFDDPDRAEVMWERVRPHVPPTLGRWSAVGLNERWRFYRYAPGQRFAWHHDGSYIRSGRERSLLSLIFYLNDDFRGGETRFEYQSAVVTPKRGAALIFEHPLLHEGARVRSGTKYVMRSDVMYRREQ